MVHIYIFNVDFLMIRFRNLKQNSFGSSCFKKRFKALLNINFGIFQPTDPVTSARVACEKCAVAPSLRMAIAMLCRRTWCVGVCASCKISIQRLLTHNGAGRFWYSHFPSYFPGSSLPCSGGSLCIHTATWRSCICQNIRVHKFKFKEYEVFVNKTHFHFTF